MKGMACQCVWAFCCDMPSCLHDILIHDMERKEMPRAPAQPQPCLAIFNGQPRVPTPRQSTHGHDMVKFAFSIDAEQMMLVLKWLTLKMARKSSRPLTLETFAARPVNKQKTVQRAALTAPTNTTFIFPRTHGPSRVISEGRAARMTEKIVLNKMIRGKPWPKPVRLDRSCQSEANRKLHRPAEKVTWKKEALKSHLMCAYKALSRQESRILAGWQSTVARDGSCCSSMDRSCVVVPADHLDPLSQLKGRRRRPIINGFNFNFEIERKNQQSVFYWPRAFD